MLIIGAGMAGLVAANYFRKSTPLVIERQASLPHNHRALLRFRTNAISDITGIPFRRVFVQKEIISEGRPADRPTIRMGNMYGLKVTGEIRSRSVWNLTNDYRYIAPTDFIPLLASGVRCSYGTEFTLKDVRENPGPIISTIPMPALMRIVGWKDIPEFSYRPIWAVNVKIVKPPADVFQTLYYPDLNIPIYRASIIGSELIIEFAEEPADVQNWAREVSVNFGLPAESLEFSEDPVCIRQEYGKIVPIEEGLRQEFIYSMTRNFGIYSLGRYATWRQILLDDLQKDLKTIETLIGAESKRKLYMGSLQSIRSETP